MPVSSWKTLWFLTSIHQKYDRGRQAGGISYEDDMLTTLCEKMEGKQAGAQGAGGETEVGL